MTENTAAKIIYEVGQIDKLLTDAEPLFAVCRIKEPDFIERSAMAMFLHSFYNGIENILLLIAKQHNFIPQESVKWHKSLLDWAFSQPCGVPVFSSQIKAQLEQFMLFRHFVRHSYGHVILWQKMKPLVENVIPVWKEIKESCSKLSM